MPHEPLRPPSLAFPPAATLQPRPDDPLGAAAQRGMLALLQRLEPRLAQAHRGDDVEGVHQLRVTTRRLRSALQTFESLWPERAREWVRGLGQLADACGRARDLDVLVEDLRRRLPASAGSREAALAWMLAQAEAERARCQASLRDDLERFCRSGLLEELVEALANTPCDLTGVGGAGAADGEGRPREAGPSPRARGGSEAGAPKRR